MPPKKVIELVIDLKKVNRVVCDIANLIINKDEINALSSEEKALVYLILNQLYIGELIQEFNIPKKDEPFVIAKIEESLGNYLNLFLLQAKELNDDFKETDDDDLDIKKGRFLN